MRFIAPRKSSIALAVASLFVGVSLNYASTAPDAPLSVSELTINSTTAASQTNAVVARDGVGNTVIVWQGNGSGDTDGIFLRRYDANGVALGGETIVNTTTAGIQRKPTVAVANDGRFVVAWESADDADGHYNVKARRYSATGTALDASEFQVNTYTTNDQADATVGMASDGSFVVAWRSIAQPGDASGNGVFAQRFSGASTLTPVGSEFLVNTFTTNSQSLPSLAVQSNGDFAIAWQSNTQEGASAGNGIYLQRFDGSTGVAVGGEVHVNTTTANEQQAPQIAALANGGYAVTWQGQTGALDYDVFMQRFDGTGLADGGETTVAGGSGDQKAARLAVDLLGNLVVAWQGADADLNGVYYQRFDSTGAAVGSVVAANSTTSGEQNNPAVGIDADGDYVVAWQSNGSSYDIKARRYTGPENVNVSVSQADTPDPAAGSANLKYTVTVTNNHAAASNGVGTATGIVVTDTLPATTFATYNSTTGDVPANWSCVASGTPTSTVTCTYLKTLAAGASASFTVDMTTAAISALAGSGSSGSNTATVVSDQYDATQADNSTAEPTAACFSASGGPSSGTAQFSAATYAATEGAGATATLTVTRSGGSCGQLDVSYATADGSAKAPGDYVTKTGTVSFADGSTTSQTITVNLTDDDVNEAAESFTVTLADPAERGALGTQKTATVNVADNDPSPTLTLSSTPASIGETGGSATVTATLNKASDQDISVELSYGGTATAGTDWATNAATDPAQIVSTISIPHGQTTGSISINARDDLTDENDETVTAGISRYTVGTTVTTPAAQTQTITIADNDDAPQVQFSAATQSFAEGAGTKTVTLSLSQVSAKSVSVDVTAGGTATSGAGNDYTLTNAGGGAFTQTQTIPAGSTSVSFNVVMNDDNLDEDAETVVFSLGNPVNASVGTTNPQTFTITDNDAAPKVTFSADASYSEGSGNQSVTVTATLDRASSHAISVPFSVGGGTPPAVYNQDFNNLAVSAGTAAVDGSGGTLTIAAGQTTGTITYGALDDALNDAAGEQIVVTMGTPAEANGLTDRVYATKGTKTTHTETITDNDATLPVVQFDQSSQTVNEDAGTTTMTVSIPAATGRDVTVNFAMGGTAANGTDYTVSPASSLTIPQGQTSATLSFGITFDTTDEADETAVATLSSPSGATLTGGRSSDTLTIVNVSNLPTVSLAASTQDVIENVMLGQALITVQLSRAIGDDVTVTFNTTTPMALAHPADPADFGVVTVSPLVIPAGSTSADIVVDITDDNIHEFDQGFVVTLTSASNATLAAPTQNTVTILDNEAAPVLSFSADADSVAEGAPVTVTVDASILSEKTTRVDYTVGGTATAGAVDHDAVGGTFTLAPGASSASYSFNTQDDGTDEDDETVVLTLQNPSHASIGTPGAETVTIVDNDAAPTVNLSVTGSPFSENGGTATVTATLSAASAHDVTVNLGFAGSATLASDYSRSGTSITIAAGATTGSIQLTGIDDAIDESAEDVVVSLDSLVNATAGTTSSVTATVSDNDAAPAVSLSLLDSPLAENAGKARVIATLSQASGRDVTVNLVFGGGALKGVDYKASAASVVIPAGALSRPVAITGLDDALDEANEAVVVKLGTLVNAVAGTTTQVTATITDDDATPTVALSSSGSSMTEVGGSATITATLSAVSGRQVTVNLAFTGGATRGSDYTASAAKIVIPAGSLTGSITLTAVDDALDEADEKAITAISSATNADGSAAASVPVTITDDDAAPLVALSLTGSPLAENGGVATVTATLSTVSGRQVTVNLGFGGTATSGSDYAASDVRIVIPAGATSRSITLTGTDDFVVEGDETVDVDIGTVTNGTEDGVQSVTATVTDDD